MNTREKASKIEEAVETMEKFAKFMACQLGLELEAKYSQAKTAEPTCVCLDLYNGEFEIWVKWGTPKRGLKAGVYYHVYHVEKDDSIKIGYDAEAWDALYLVYRHILQNTFYGAVEGFQMEQLDEMKKFQEM
jgi:hypothetical protein